MSDVTSLADTLTIQQKMAHESNTLFLSCSLYVVIAKSYLPVEYYQDWKYPDSIVKDAGAIKSNCLTPNVSFKILS